VCHCRSQSEAERLRSAVAERFASCGLKLNEEKTRIVCCKAYKEVLSAGQAVSFDFLGYTFQPRKARRKAGSLFTGYLPGISKKSKSRINEAIRQWELSRKTYMSLKDIARLIEPQVRGWITYYDKFYGSALKIFLGVINHRIAHWLSRKYKRFRGRPWQALYWLGAVAKRDKTLFLHWRYGVTPVASKSQRFR
jgi:RNA-directed DNA polymerase